MKTSVLLIALLVTGLYCNAQIGKEIYRSETRVESPDIGTYNVNVLILDKDGSFELLWQTYSSKKMARNNIVLSLKRERGTWDKNNEVLTLSSEKGNEILKFSIKSSNKIAKMVDQSQVSSLNWKKVSY